MSVRAGQDIAHPQKDENINNHSALEKYQEKVFLPKESPFHPEPLAMQLRMASSLTSPGKVISVYTRVQSYGADTARVSIEAKGQLCEPLLSSQFFVLVVLELTL